jgi:uncharacterized protein
MPSTSRLEEKMMSLTPRDVVARVFDALAKGDLGAAEQLFDPALRIHEPASLPYGGRHDGAAGFRRLFGRFAELYDDLAIPPSSIHDAGPFVVALTTLSGRVKATGSRIEMPLCEIFVVRGGRVMSITPFYWDTALTQLALSPSGNNVNAVVGAPWVVDIALPS